MKLAHWWRVLRQPQPDWWPSSPAWDATPLSATRWVVLDTETSGFSPVNDRLLSVAVVTVRGASLPLAEQWYATVQPPEESDFNDSVLVHRLTPGALADGVPVAEAMRTLTEWVADAPVLAFHHGHDRGFIKAAMYQMGYPMLPWRWLEMADVLPIAWPEASDDFHTLDDWLAWQAIVVEERHHAWEDAWVSALLWVKALAALQQRGIHTRADLMSAMRARQRIRRMRQHG